MQPLVRQQELVRQPERAPPLVPEPERAQGLVLQRVLVRARLRAPERQLFHCPYRRCCRTLPAPTPVRDRRLLRI